MLVQVVNVCPCGSQIQLRVEGDRGGLLNQAGFSVGLDLSIQRQKYKGKIDL